MKTPLSLFQFCLALLWLIACGPQALAQPQAADVDIANGDDSQAVEVIELQDDLGNRLVLQRPAQRIISLAPHLTENIFAVGAGHQLVGVSQYSDYPAAAKSITRVGDYQAINVEQILMLQPDLILAWADGGNQRALASLAAMGIPIYWSRPVTLESIGRELNQLALLTGQQATGQAALRVFKRDLAQLKPAQTTSPVSVFYQVWANPLQTLNDNSLIGGLIKRCGGRNIFGQAAAVVAQVDVESVLAANPDVILGSHSSPQQLSWKEQWQQWPAMTAVAKSQVHSINADYLSRHTPRVLLGAKQVCDYLRAAATQAPHNAGD